MGGQAELACTTAAVSKTVEPAQAGLVGSSPTPSASVSLAEWLEAAVFQTVQAGSIPAGHSRGSSNGRTAVFEAENEGSIPSPRTSGNFARLRKRNLLRGS